MYEIAKRHGILSADGIVPMYSICRVPLPLALMHMLHIHHRYNDGSLDQARYKSSYRFYMDIVKGKRGT